jgi:DNA-binding transcriptional LysR family regulator
MSDHHPTFRQLEALVAVMETGSMTRAAKRMHVSQPALSRLIANLETDLGYAMFRRAGGRLAPTAEAELLREEIKNALSAVDHARRRAHQLGSFQEGGLAICAFPSLAATPLPRLLAGFCARNPKLKVTLNSMHWRQMLEEVALQRADFAISDLPAHANGVLAEHLSRYHGVCVVQPQHRFASLATVPLPAIAEERFVWLGEEDDARTRTIVQEAFRANGINVNGNAEVSLSASACAWISAAGGCAIVDSFAAEEWRGRLVWVNTDPPIVFDLWLLRSEVKPMSRIAVAFLEILRSYLGTLPGARHAR